METEEKKLKKKLNINNIILIIVLILLAITLCVFFINLVSVKNELNNNDGNLGLVDRNKNNIYYYDYSKGLIKKDKKTEKVLVNEQAYSIQYFDGKIYYSNPNSAGGVDIKSIDENGKDNKILISITSNSTKMYIKDSKIYFLTSNPNTISKVDIDGKNPKAILQRDVVDFKVINNTIYFSDVMGFLYSIDTNGENYKTISEKSLFSKFQIVGKYVYFYNSEKGEFSKMNLEDTSKIENITNKLDCDTYNVTVDGIYYFEKKNKKIKFISLNGKKDKEIIGINTDSTKINIDNNVIYYIDNESGKMVTKLIKTNGKAVK